MDFHFSLRKFRFLTFDFTIFDFCICVHTARHRLWQTLKNPFKQFKLLNIFTGEIWILSLNYHELIEIVVFILRGKYTLITPKTDEEFNQFCWSTIKSNDDINKCN